MGFDFSEEEVNLKKKKDFQCVLGKVEALLKSRVQPAGAKFITAQMLLLKINEGRAKAIISQAQSGITARARTQPEARLEIGDWRLGPKLLGNTNLHV